MIPVPSNIRIWLATGHTDMRKGMTGLTLLVQEHLKRDPHVGDVYVFRGRRGDLLKIVWHDGIGLSLYAKRLDRGRFVWPATAAGAVVISKRNRRHVEHLRSDHRIPLRAPLESPWSHSLRRLVLVDLDLRDRKFTNETSSHRQGFISETGHPGDPHRRPACEQCRRIPERARRLRARNTLIERPRRFPSSRILRSKCVSALDGRFKQ